MEAYLFCSYRSPKNRGGHPSRIRLRFRTIGNVVSSDLATDSMGGPKSTILQLVSDDAVPKHQVCQNKEHSFLVREVKNTFRNPVQITKVHLKVSFSRQLGAGPGQEDMDGENHLFYDPKLELLVHESSSPVPILLITDQTILKRQIFSSDMFLWFKELMAGAPALEVVYENDDFAYKIEGALDWIPLGLGCTRLLISNLLKFISKGLESQNTPQITAIPTLAGFENLVRAHMRLQLEAYNRAVLFLSQAIPRLDSEGSDPNSEWVGIQEALQTINGFLEEICSVFRGLSGLTRLERSVESPHRDRHWDFQQAILRSIEDPWLAKHDPNLSHRKNKIEACKFLGPKLVSHDLVANMGIILETVGAQFPEFQAFAIKELAVSAIFQSILFGSSSFEQIHRRSDCDVISRSLKPDQHLSIFKKQPYECLTFTADFAYMLDIDVLRVWPRGRDKNKTIDPRNERSFSFFPPRHPRPLLLLGHYGNFIVVKAGAAHAQIGGGLFFIFDTTKFLAGATEKKDYVKKFRTDEPTDQHFCTDDRYFYSFKPNLGSEGSSMFVTNLDSVSFEPHPDNQDAPVCRVELSYRVVAAFSSPKLPHVFVAYGEELGCWSWRGDNLDQTAHCVLDGSPPQEPRNAFTDRESLSRIRCVNLQPIFFESRGKAYFAQILFSDFLQLYGFYNNQFIPMKKQGKRLCKPPAGYFWLSDTSGTKSTLCAAKLTSFDPKTFKICKLILH